MQWTKEEGEGRSLDVSLPPLPFPLSPVHFLFPSPHPPQDTSPEGIVTSSVALFLRCCYVYMWLCCQVLCLKCFYMYICLLYLGMFLLSLVKILETWAELVKAGLR